jgi:hypothetical protein
VALTPDGTLTATAWSCQMDLAMEYTSRSQSCTGPGCQDLVGIWRSCLGGPLDVFSRSWDERGRPFQSGGAEGKGEMEWGLNNCLWCLCKSMAWILKPEPTPSFDSEVQNKEKLSSHLHSSFSLTRRGDTSPWGVFS